MNALTVGQVARQLGIAPWVLSNLFYRGRLDDAKCPIVMGRRMIPPGYVSAIARMLRQSGQLVDSERRDGSALGENESR